VNQELCDEFPVMAFCRIIPGYRGFSRISAAEIPGFGPDLIRLAERISLI